MMVPGSCGFVHLVFECLCFLLRASLRRQFGLLVQEWQPGLDDGGAGGHLGVPKKAPKTGILGSHTCYCKVKP